MDIQERIQGSLIGAVIGAELAYARVSQPQLCAAVRGPEDLLKTEMIPNFEWKPDPTNHWIASLTPLVQYWEIDRKYPGGVRTVLDPGRLEAEGDNQMAMLLVETYIEREGLPVMARHFGQTWHDRLNRQAFPRNGSPCSAKPPWRESINAQLNLLKWRVSKS